MSIQFKTGERATFYGDVAGLAEVMAGFIRHLPPAKRREAIAKVKHIQEFLSVSRLKLVTIQHFSSNDFGFSIACEKLGKPKGDKLQVNSQELESLWLEFTSKWRSQHHLLTLKMNLYVLLPGTDVDEEMEALVTKNSSIASQEFRDRLGAEDAALEARLKDPAYLQQLPG